MKYDDLYRNLDKQLRIILGYVRDQFSEDAVSEILEYIDVREYGVALETLCDVLRREKIPVPEACYSLIVVAGESMELDPDDNWLGILVST